MKARNWTTWEGYLPSAGMQGRAGIARLCLQPWDQILPQEGVEERMICTEEFWRTWERYLVSKETVATGLLPLGLKAETLQKVPV